MQNKAMSERLYVSREPVEGVCPKCGADGQLATYHVNSEGGWFTVVKCQNCLHSVSREPWKLLGPVSLLVDTIRGAAK
jgi:hypothetical protein